ncbi:MAG: hypothetical protein ABJB55_04740 [Actinomycetota bacterium]
MRTRVLALATMLLTGLLVWMPGSEPATATINPADFSAPVANPYFPLKPGTVFVYRGTEGPDHLVEHLRVTRRTKDILGVTTIVISDVLHKNGRLAEKTTDWYADDNGGTAWYFGEHTALYNRQGNVTSREGSWEAGVKGGLAGIIMPADPKPTDAYRQEFLAGHAEDQAWIVARHGRARVPYGRVTDVVRSYEWTRLEPNVTSLKLYAPHLGIVQEVDVAGGEEFLQLVAVQHF